MNLKLVREASLETAKKLGYPINPSLPMLDVPSACRGQSEIVDRILGMNGVAACAYGFSREMAQAWCEREVPPSALTIKEREFLRTGVGDKEQFTFQIEGIWELAWTIRLVDVLDFGQPCSSRFVTLLPDLKKSQKGADIRLKASIRPLADLISASDLAYCLHWAIRQIKAGHATLPRNTNPYVIIERRRALEWVLSSYSWDEISLDT